MSKLETVRALAATAPAQTVETVAALQTQLREMSARLEALPSAIAAQLAEKTAHAQASTNNRVVQETARVAAELQRIQKWIQQQAEVSTVAVVAVIVGIALGATAVTVFDAWWSESAANQRKLAAWATEVWARATPQEQAQLKRILERETPTQR